MLDFTKPLQTRSGLKVTVFTAEARGGFPVIGMVHEPNIDSIATWTMDGAFHADGRQVGSDLVQVVETVKKYLPVYDDGSVGMHQAVPALRGYTRACQTLEDTDPHARYILELVYDGRRLENVNVIRRGEVTP